MRLPRHLRHIDVPQGSREWFEARAGVVTASCADKLLTPKKLEQSKATDYFHHLVAECVLGRPIQDEAYGWADRGIDLQADALRFYEMERGVEVEEVGFLLRTDGRVGCSPDGLVGDEGGVELKCPSAKVHVANLLDPQAFALEHRGQVQMSLLLTLRPWWDLVSFNPAMPSLVVRCEPDPTYLAALEPAIEALVRRVKDAMARLAPSIEAFNLCPIR